MEEIRCFISLELPREIMKYIEELQEQLTKNNFFYGKFTEIENLHLTLKFLGEISEDKVEQVKKKLKEIDFKEFEVFIGEMGVFSKRSFKILWVKLLNKKIIELQKLIDDKVRELGFSVEERFMGHITLARIKKVVKKTEFLNYIKNLKLRKIKFRVKDFVLKKSVLTREGPNYQDLERYSLREGI